MSRQVLTLPDVPPTLLTQPGADPVYVNAAGDTMSGGLVISTGGIAVTGTSTFSAAPTVGGSALQTQTAADARYLALTGGTLSGALYIPNNFFVVGDINLSYNRTEVYDDHVNLINTGEAYPRTRVYAGYLQLGAGTATPDVTLNRTGANAVTISATTSPATTNARDLGTTTLRWRKLWATDVDTTNAPTVGGVSLDTRYVAPTLADAKGDLLAASAPDALARLPVGTNGQVLTADSAQALGVRWATPAAGFTAQNPYQVINPPGGPAASAQAWLGSSPTDNWAYLAYNAHYSGPGTWAFDDTTKAALVWVANGGSPLSVYTAPASANPPGWVQRLGLTSAGVLTAYGGLSLPASVALNLAGTAWVLSDTGGNLQYSANAAHMWSINGANPIYMTSGFLYTPTDNTVSLGLDSNRWSAGYFRSEVRTPQVTASTGDLTLLSSSNWIVLNPGAAWVRPVNETVNLGHPSYRFATMHCITFENYGEIHCQGTLKANGNGIIQAGSDAGAFCQYRYDQIIANWNGWSVTNNNMRINLAPYGPSPIIAIENSSTGFYAATGTLVVDCGRSDRRWVKVYCQSVDQSCTETVKEAITDLDPQDVLADLLRTPVVAFKYRDLRDEDLSPKMTKGDFREPMQVGIIAERTPARFLASPESANPMAIAAVAVAGVQALHAQIAALREEVARLKEAP
jgi:hypothetical protein